LQRIIKSYKSNLGTGKILKIQGKKFVVIGGAGLIGSHLVEQLLNAKASKVIVFDNFYRGKINNLKSCLGNKSLKILKNRNNILDPKSLDSAIKGTDGVFHLAALWLLECYNKPEKAFEVNIKGTFNVIQSCLRNKVKKLVFSSSASVYGDAITKYIKEDHPFYNKNFYGATKICGEAILTAMHYRYGLNFVGLWYMNVYGPRQDNKGAYIAVIMKMINAIKEGKSPVIAGTGKESFDFINVKDCARANIQAMKSKINNQFYNVGTGKKTSLKSLAINIMRVMKSKKKIKYKKNKKLGLVKNRVANVIKIHKDLKFKYSIKLNEGLKDLIKSF
jgi:UDP-glucose 4-epimerase